MASASQAGVLLQKQLTDRVDGFSAGLVDDNNLVEWSVLIIGPPDTLYEGGFLKAITSFPQDYPNSPPTVKFITSIWHPNVFANGKVCISILHPPSDDSNGYDLASERWSPDYTVESVLWSIISMLSSPVDESPANVEAAKQWRENRMDYVKKRLAASLEDQQRRHMIDGLSYFLWCYDDNNCSWRLRESVKQVLNFDVEFM